MKFITLLLILTSFHCWSLDVAIIEAEVKNLCPNLNSLLLKKSLIEIIKGKNECQGNYSGLLLKSCPRLTCNSYIEIVNKNASTKGGRVVGE